MRMKIQLFKIFGIQQRQSWEGNTVQFKHPSKKLEKNPSNTQANLAPKGTWERTANKTYTQQKRVNKYSSRLNEIESRRTVDQINKTRNWFFDRIYKIDKSLASLIKKKREETQINKIMNEKGEITTNTKEIQTILKTYYVFFFFCQLALLLPTINNLNTSLSTLSADDLSSHL